MRIRLLICLTVIAGSTMGGFPFIVRVAAQEIPQCIFEGQPCGTPQQLYERIQHCLQDPNLCRDVRTNRAGDDRGNGSSHPARGPSSPDRATTLLSTKPTVRSQDVRPRQPASVPVGKVPAAEAPTAELPGGPADAVTRAAGELPLDPAVRH
jgi:hypothetical protein